MDKKNLKLGMVITIGPLALLKKISVAIATFLENLTLFTPISQSVNLNMMRPTIDTGH